MITLYTQTFVHRNTSTHKRFYTLTLLQTRYTQTLLHTHSFTHKQVDTQTGYTQSFYTQTLLHMDATTHRHFHTHTLLHAIVFTHRNVYTQTFVHRNISTYKHAYTPTLLQTRSRSKAFAYTQLFYTRTPFPATGLDTWISFRAKGCRQSEKITILNRRSWHSNLIWCDRVAAEAAKLQLHHSFDSRTSFRAKGWLRRYCPHP